MPPIFGRASKVRGSGRAAKVYLSCVNQKVAIRSLINHNSQFPIQKCAIFCKFKEIKELRGGILLYAAQAVPPIDAEIVEKGHLWTETGEDS